MFYPKYTILILSILSILSISFLNAQGLTDERKQKIAEILQETNNWYHCAVKVPVNAYPEPKADEEAIVHHTYKSDQLRCEPIAQDQQKWQRVLLYPHQQERMTIKYIETVYLKNLDSSEQYNQSKSTKIYFLLIAIFIVAVSLIILLIKDMKKNVS